MIYKIKIFLFIYFLGCLPAKTQSIQCKVLDADNNKPLYFATIVYGKEAKITFSDSLGRFFLSKEILNTSDSLAINFIGYTTKKIASKQIVSTSIFYLKNTSQKLEEIVVNSCKEYEKIDLKNKLKGNSHFSVSPFIPYVFASYYSNNINKVGYINTFSLKIETHNAKIRITPVRLHWYSYNKETGTIDKELTDTNIVLHPYQSGKNTFIIPDRTIFFGEDGIVLGIEFLYTHEDEISWEISKDKKENNWIENNAWFFAVQRTSIVEGFQGWSSDYKTFKPFESVFNNQTKKYFKPLFNFTIKICKL